MKIEGKTDNHLVSQLTITTVGPAYEKSVYGPFGKTGQVEWSFEGHVVGFYGRSGSFLDNIGMYSMEVLKKSAFFGGTGGSEVDDKTNVLIPPVVMIDEIQVTKLIPSKLCIVISTTQPPMATNLVKEEVATSLPSLLPREKRLFK